VRGGERSLSANVADNVIIRQTLKSTDDRGPVAAQIKPYLLSSTVSSVLMRPLNFDACICSPFMLTSSAPIH
jgi:hypothetical protein